MKSYFKPSLVTTVVAQCLPYGKQGMGTQVQPTSTLKENPLGLLRSNFLVSGS